MRVERETERERERERERGRNKKRILIFLREINQEEKQTNKTRVKERKKE